MFLHLAVVDAVLFTLGFFLIAEDAHAKKHGRKNLFGE